jgi:hypothetical protein
VSGTISFRFVWDTNAIIIRLKLYLVSPVFGYFQNCPERISVTIDRPVTLISCHTVWFIYVSNIVKSNGLFHKLYRFLPCAFRPYMLTSGGLLMFVKLKQSHNTPMEARGERRYSSYSFKNSALDRVCGQRHAQAKLYPQGKDPRYPLYRRLDGPQSRSGHRLEGKMICLCRGSKLDRSVVQSVTRHYTDWATLLPTHACIYIYSVTVCVSIT